MISNTNNPLCAYRWYLRPLYACPCWCQTPILTDDGTFLLTYVVEHTDNLLEVPTSRHLAS